MKSTTGGLVSAHVGLLKTEIGVIVEQAKIIALLAGMMLGLALLLVTLLYTGTWLFLGEWLFGSMGWGLLHGTLATLGIIAALGLVLIGNSPRVPVLALGLAVAVGALLSLLFASNLLRNAFVALADALEPVLRLDGGAMTGLHVTLLAMTVVLGLLGLLAGLRAGAAGAIGGLAAGAVLGALFGFALGGDSLDAAYPMLAGALVGLIVLGLAGLALGAKADGARGALSGFGLGGSLGVVIGSILGAVTYDLKGAVAIGVTIGLLAWPAFQVMLAMREGIAPEKRFGKLVPNESMTAAKETRSWLGQEWQRQRSKLTKR
ncbi:MAG: hypothetical protein M3452_10855 [Chloroflexota bacterium]|nr:hypothetical protein [Chloroflexota bacterium]